MIRYCMNKIFVDTSAWIAFLNKNEFHHLFSYADAVSFALMQKEKINDAFTYDRHFLTAGFTTINYLTG